MARRRRLRGSGSIQDRPGGKFLAQWSGGFEGGKRVRRSALFTLRREAEWWLREAERAGQPPDATETLGEYLDRWVGAVRPSIRPSTFRSYAGHVHTHLAPALGHLRLSAIRPADVEGLIAAMLEAGRSPATVAHVVTTLRIALRRAVKRRELLDNAAADVVLPRVPDHQVRPLTSADARLLVEAVSGTWIGPIVRFLLGSGVRLGEATSLNQGDVLEAEGYVRLRASKTRIRAVPVSADGMAALMQAIADAPRRGKTEPVFFSPRPNRASGVRDRLAGSSVSHALPRLLEAAGLSRLTPHGLRHGTATLMLAAGTPMRVIAEQLGHRNPATTARLYSHVVPEAQRRALDVLDEAVRER